MPLGDATGDRSVGPVQNGTPKQPEMEHEVKLQEQTGKR